MRSSDQARSFSPHPHVHRYQRHPHGTQAQKDEGTGTNISLDGAKDDWLSLPVSSRPNLDRDVKRSTPSWRNINPFGPVITLPVHYMIILHDLENTWIDEQHVLGIFSEHETDGISCGDLLYGLLWGQPLAQTSPCRLPDSATEIKGLIPFWGRKC